MNKTQVIEVINKSIRGDHYTNPIDELKIVLQLLAENPLRKEHQAIETMIHHLRGIISLENDNRDKLTQSMLKEVYGD